MGLTISESPCSCWLTFFTLQRSSETNISLHVCIYHLYVQSARKAAAEQRAEEEKRQFQKLIAVYRDSGSTFRETKASVRKAEETRLKIQQGHEVCRQSEAVLSLVHCMYLSNTPTIRPPQLVGFR